MRSASSARIARSQKRRERSWRISTGCSPSRSQERFALRLSQRSLTACEASRRQPLRALHTTAGLGRQDARLLASRSAALFGLGRFGGARAEIEKALALDLDPEMLSLRELIRQAA